ncbi:MAG TPA: ACP S-malonyltransferase [Candidatus Acidoferrales bacterium]|nr:ACP S-malonyltransferase [Candidatus Acidoferrales bacterium]
MRAEPRVAFVFPGQGSQRVGMGKRWCEEFAEARRVFEEAEDALGLPLRKICFSGPEEELKLTRHAQPAILTVSIAAWRVLQATGALAPACVAGHSLGEYSALVSAGALAFGDAVKIVYERGRLMQEAVAQGEGSMAAVMGLDEREVERLCAEAAGGEVVGIAGLNGGGQIVIAGARGAVLRAKELALQAGAKSVVELPVSAPFHCALMKPAAEGLERVLEKVDVRPYSIGVVTNVEAKVNLDPLRVKGLLVRQVVSPVRWEESVKEIERLGCTGAIEIGPGRVLRGLIKRISPALVVHNLETPEDLSKVARAAAP